MTLDNTTCFELEAVCGKLCGKIVNVKNKGQKMCKIIVLSKKIIKMSKLIYLKCKISCAKLETNVLEVYHNRSKR